MSTDQTPTAELRDILDEAEDVRRAIAAGEVDAFVVGQDDTRRVLLLANAYQRYRQLVEHMHQGAVTVTPQGNILYANQRFSRLLGIPLAQLYTAPLDAYVGIVDRARLGGFLLLSARESALEVRLQRRDGSQIPVRLKLVTFTDGYATLLVSDLRPMQWPALTVDALDSIRAALEKLERGASAAAAARESLASIAEQVSGLARMIDEMHDVESPREER